MIEDKINFSAMITLGTSDESPVKIAFSINILSANFTPI